MPTAIGRPRRLPRRPAEPQGSGMRDGGREMRSRIRAALDEVALSYGPRARETILLENAGKHVYEIERILSALPERGSALDLGGGLGVNLRVVRRLRPEAELVLVDRLREYTPDNRMGPAGRGVELMECDGIRVIERDFWEEPQLPFAADAFDVVTVLDVVEHLPGHPLRQLRELERVARPGGHCLLSGPNAASLKKRVDLVLGRHPYIPFEEWTGDWYHLHIREYTPAEYRSLLERAGFVDVQVVLSRLVWQTRARHRYHRRVHGRASPVAAGIYAMLALETLFPRLRHTVYAAARKRSG